MDFSQRYLAPKKYILYIQCVHRKVFGSDVYRGKILYSVTVDPSHF